MVRLGIYYSIKHMKHSQYILDDAKISSKQMRVFGIILLLVGLTLCYFFMIKPIIDASEGVKQITIYRKFAIASLAFMLFGLLMIILGNKAKLILLPPKKKGSIDFKAIPLACWITLTISVSSLLAIWIWFEKMLKNLGYSSY